MIYFVSGHIDLSYEDFQKYYVPILSDIISRELHPTFVVGDCNGVDKFAMDYIYNNVHRGELHIYHMFNSPRNTPEGFIGEDCNISNKYNWTYIKDFLEIKFVGGFQSDIERDSAMTENSDYDIAFVKDNRWKSGTAQNIKRRHNIV